MMPWLILGIVSLFFFKVWHSECNGNGDIELDSARELGKVDLLPTPTNPGAGNDFGMFTIFYLIMLSCYEKPVILSMHPPSHEGCNS